MCKGETGIFTVKNSYLFQATPADRNVASFRGPKEINFIDTEIPQGIISFNPEGSWNQGFVTSLKATFKGCTGGAKVMIAGEVVGTVNQDKSYDLV